MNEEVKRSVTDALNQETVCSEECISPIITHEVAMHLSALESDEKRIAEVTDAASQVIRGLRESQVPFHSYAIAEATRGIIHGLVCAGLDVSYITRPATKGIREALYSLDCLSRETEAGMRAGVKQALNDLGMERLEDDQSLELPEYFANESIVFGHPVL